MWACLESCFACLAYCLYQAVYRAFHAGHGPLSNEEERKRKAQRLRLELEDHEMSLRPPKLPEARRNVSKISISSQPDCRLLSLPPELRHRIYELALGGGIMHITHTAGRLAHHKYETTFNDEKQLPVINCFQAPWYPHGNWYTDDHIKWSAHYERIPLSDQFSKNSASLLRTCRAIYREAHSVLYTHNIFSVSEPIVLEYLRDYSLRPQHFALITHLRLRCVYCIDYRNLFDMEHKRQDSRIWNRFWKLVSTMNLQSLRVHVHLFGQQDIYPDTKEGFIRPMLDVQGIPNVEITIERAPNFEPIKMPDLEDEIRERWSQVRPG